MSVYLHEGGKHAPAANCSEKTPKTRVRLVDGWLNSQIKVSEPPCKDPMLAARGDERAADLS